LVEAEFESWLPDGTGAAGADLASEDFGTAGFAGAFAGAEGDESVAAAPSAASFFATRLSRGPRIKNSPPTTITASASTPAPTAIVSFDVVRPPAVGAVSD